MKVKTYAKGGKMYNLIIYKYFEKGIFDGDIICTETGACRSEYLRLFSTYLKNIQSDYDRMEAIKLRKEIAASNNLPRQSYKDLLQY